MYDFANSGYTTVVVTAVFHAYFVSVIAGNAPWATFAWTATLSVSYAVILLTGPILGAYAALRAAKKRLLVLTTAGCVIATALLALTGPGTLAIAVVLLVFSNFCFGSGENLIAAFLPELALGEFGQERGDEVFPRAEAEVGKHEQHYRNGERSGPSEREQGGRNHATSRGENEQALFCGTQGGISSKNRPRQQNHCVRDRQRRRPREGRPRRVAGDHGDEISVEDGGDYDRGVTRVGKVVHRPG